MASANDGKPGKVGIIAQAVGVAGGGFLGTELVEYVPLMLDTPGCVGSGNLCDGHFVYLPFCVRVNR